MGRKWTVTELAGLGYDVVLETNLSGTVCGGFHGSALGQAVAVGDVYETWPAHSLFGPFERIEINGVVVLNQTPAEANARALKLIEMAEKINRGL